MKIIGIYLLFVNVLSFLIYGLDKWKAKAGKWRIPEKTLLFLAAFGGSVGAFCGMRIFRHKTNHKKFVIGVPLILLLHLVIVYFLWVR